MWTAPATQSRSFYGASYGSVAFSGPLRQAAWCANAPRPRFTQKRHVAR